MEQPESPPPSTNCFSQKKREKKKRVSYLLSHNKTEDGHSVERGWIDGWMDAHLVALANLVAVAVPRVRVELERLEGARERSPVFMCR